MTLARHGGNFPAYLRLRGTRVRVRVIGVPPVCRVCMDARMQGCKVSFFFALLRVSDAVIVHAHYSCLLLMR